MDSEPKTRPDNPGEDDPAQVARAEADLAAVQAAQTDQPAARAKVAPPSESPGRASGGTRGPSDAGGAPAGRPRERGELGREVDVLAARVEGMAVTMRDMARVALAAVLLAVIALLVSLYVLRAVRGASAAA